MLERPEITQLKRRIQLGLQTLLADFLDILLGATGSSLREQAFRGKVESPAKEFKPSRPSLVWKYEPAILRLNQ